MNHTTKFILVAIDVVDLSVIGVKVVKAHGIGHPGRGSTDAKYENSENPERSNCQIILLEQVGGDTLVTQIESLGLDDLRLVLDGHGCRPAE